MEDPIEDAGNLMSSPMLSIDSGLTVQEAAQQMHAKNVSSFLVKKGKKYVGFITETDLARKVVALGLDNETTSVSFVMTKPFLSVDRCVPIREAEEFMKQNELRHLAVTEEDEVVGMLSTKDLVTDYSKAFKVTE